MTERKFEQIEETLCNEVEKIADKGTIDGRDLDTLDKLMHTLKNTYKVHMGPEGEYSQDGGWTANGIYSRGVYGNSYNDRTSYRDGNSYARGRGSYAKRDAMGRYSSADIKEEMSMKLEEMLDMAETSREKEAIRNCMSQIQNS